MIFLKQLPLRSLSFLLECHTRTIFPSVTLCTRKFHNTTPNLNLMEFFDDKKNWGTTEIKSGRSWRREELRLKSNTDLHKLWYVLLKEKNMLLTMEEECKQQTRLFPSPERLDKVEDSMENLEAVVKERNKAYHMLETGKPGIRQSYKKKNVFGLKVDHTEKEYLVPRDQNQQWLTEHTHNPNDPDIKRFLAKYREKEAKERRKAITRDTNHVMGLIKRFPKLDLEAVKEQYPDANIEKAKKSHKSRGHFVPEKYNFNQ